MRRRLGIALAAALVTGALAAGAPPAAAEAGSVEIVVAFEDGVAHRQRGRAHRVASVAARPVDHLPEAGADVVRLPAGAAAGALAAYQRQPGVRYAEPVHTVRALAPPPDEHYAELQWHLQPASATNLGTLNWEPVWPDHTGAGITVAVIDSGYRPGGSDEPAHLDMDAGWDYADDDATPEDRNGHGTHIANTIAERTGNTVPDGEFNLAGVASGARIVPLKVLDDQGSGDTLDLVRAIDYAVDPAGPVKAGVVNLSLGGPNYSRLVCEAVARAARSAIVIAASGNESEGGMRPVSWPAACPGAVAVGGVRSDGTRGIYSNGGCELAVAAPGGDLSQRRLTQAGDGIWQQSWVDDPRGQDVRFTAIGVDGTSMAAAHVSGAAAVLLGLPQRPSRAVVVQALVATTRDLGAAGPDPQYGTGAVDLAAAVAAVQAGAVPAPPTRVGYWEVATDGGIFAFGDARFFGSTGNIRLNQPIMAMAPTPSRRGYWLAATDGGIFAFGDARFFGSTGNIRLNQPIVGMAPTVTGEGYWLVAADGGVFSFGDAVFHGSSGGLALPTPVVGMAATRTGAGYWMVTAGGAVFPFGDAPFLGSPASDGISVARPIVSMAPTPSGHGYWLVDAGGGVYAYGDAGFFGSTGAMRLNQPIVGMAANCRGTGYWLVAADGGLFGFGDVPFLGSMGGTRLNRPVVTMALALDHR